ncbi:MAG TPA: hypothetical protein VHX60_08655 [Acidobacteriaceae bacterium]|jgi:type II secretory pathway component PulL|nr:hypothetical protein [Acidobacteriaceae bacterium]
MGEVIAGLVLFFCVMWGLAAIHRYSDSKSEAAYLAEQEKQAKRWAEDYRKFEEKALPKASPQV